MSCCNMFSFVPTCSTDCAIDDHAEQSEPLYANSIDFFCACAPNHVYRSLW